MIGDSVIATKKKQISVYYSQPLNVYVDISVIAEQLLARCRVLLVLSLLNGDIRTLASRWNPFKITFNYPACHGSSIRLLLVRFTLIQFYLYPILPAIV